MSSGAACLGCAASPGEPTLVLACDAEPRIGPILQTRKRRPAQSHTASERYHWDRAQVGVTL